MINFRADKTYIWIGLAVLTIFIFYTFFKSIFMPEESRVRKFILEGKRAVETKNILVCAGMISTNYQDKYGNNRQTLIYVTKEFFNYYKNIFVHIESMDIKLDDSETKADVEILALVLCQSKEDKPEKIFEGEKGRFRVKLVKEDKKWQVLEIEFLEELTIMGQRIS